MSFKQFMSKKFLPIFVGNCLGVIVFTVAIVWGGLYFLDKYTLHGENISVPDMIGQPVNVALDNLSALGLKGEVTDTGYIDSRPGGVIIEQNIHPGEEVKRERIVYLVVNADQARQVALPDGIAGNCSMREAELRLKAKGLRVGAPHFIKGDLNWVYEIKDGNKVLKPGDMVSVKHPLTLVVGDGSIDEEYIVNDSAFVDSLHEVVPSANPQATPEEEELFD